MSISINNLLDYLQNNNENMNIENDVKVLDKDDTDNLINIKEFNNIFGDYIERYGIISHNKDKNISFLYSLLYLIDDEYYLFSSEEQLTYINALKKKLINETTKKNLLKNLNLKGNGWNKKTLVNLLKKDDINFNYIYYIASYFNINIFIVDLNDKIIYPFYNDDKFILQKTNILISLNKDIYEPLIYVDGSKYFLYNSDIIQNIVNYEKLKMPNIGFTKVIKVKVFELSNNLDEYDNNILCDINELSNDKFNNVNDLNDNNDSLPVYKINTQDIELELNSISDDYNTENNFNKYKSFSKDELLKYKKDELINICKELHIPYSNKNKIILVNLIREK